MLITNVERYLPMVLFLAKACKITTLTSQLSTKNMQTLCKKELGSYENIRRQQDRQYI